MALFEDAPLRDSYKNQVILCTFFMILVPFSTFFSLRSKLANDWIPSTERDPKKLS